MQTTFLPANILLPKKNFEKWSVIACDQYTSDEEYWQVVKDYVGDCPSSLNLILPEIYLDDAKNRIDGINRNMREYLEGDIFKCYENSYIYVVRTLKNGNVRKGIVGKVDLCDYEYTKASNALVRATEATVVSRIPPRVEIRKNATLELPHVMLLADDKDNSVFASIEKELGKFKIAYDFDLMLDSGHITGYVIDGENAEKLQSKFSKLIGDGEDKMLFAVGDGNHSLATAKVCSQKFPNELNRYALAEIVNIHDNSLKFEPIYRVLFNVEPEKIIDDFVKSHDGEYFGEGSQKFTCVYGNKKREISVKPTSKLSVGTLQKYLDEKCPEVKIDYIHGENAVKKLCMQPGTLGFIFNSMKKSELFEAIKADGALPRKTFSMGKADDKRFYIEARKIK